MRKALFPGSFDPFTKGHESIVRKAIPLFDQIVIGIGTNTSKAPLFNLEQRKKWIENTFSDTGNVSVIEYQGLTIEFCHKIQCKFILRGLRNAMDYQYESSIAQMNEAMNPDITTVLINCEARYAAINATIVREIYKSGGDISQFLPDSVKL